MEILRKHVATFDTPKHPTPPGPKEQPDFVWRPGPIDDKGRQETFVSIALQRVEAATERLVELQAAENAPPDKMKQAYQEFRDATGALALAVRDGNTAHYLLGGIWN